VARAQVVTAGRGQLKLIGAGGAGVDLVIRDLRQLDDLSREFVQQAAPSPRARCLAVA